MGDYHVVLYVYIRNGKDACGMNRSRRSFEGTDLVFVSCGVKATSRKRINPVSSATERNTSWQGGRESEPSRRKNTIWICTTSG